MFQGKIIVTILFYVCRLKEIYTWGGSCIHVFKKQANLNWMIDRMSQIRLGY